MTVTSFQPNWFSKPGDTIALLLHKKKSSVSELAEWMICDTVLAEGLITGTTAIDENIANRLEHHLGGTAYFWLTRQAQFDECLERVASAVPNAQATAWLKALPLREMIRAGWIPDIDDKKKLYKAALTFFSVSNPSEWESRYTAFDNIFSFRTSPAFESKAGPLSAWLRRGELEAAVMPCADWDASRFKSILSDIRTLTKAKNPSYFIPRLRSFCAMAGVAVVFVRAPTGCRASGATRFVSPGKALIILSFRYLSDDHFWFSFFHEAGHLLLHGEQATFIDGEADERNEKEQEANDFSANILIPRDRVEELLRLPPRSTTTIRFATSIGVSPGIVVGQLQHNHVIGPKQLNFLKRRYTWEQIMDARASP